MLRFDSRHYLTGEELSRNELQSLIEEAEVMRRQRPNSSYQPFAGKTLALIFEKPSLRTRVSFTVGFQDLGGHVMDILSSQTKTEEPEDTIRVLQGMVDGVMLRTFMHENLERMVTKARIPVINGLSDLHHPCQAIADLLTIYQRFGHLEGLRLAYVGDGNNVLHSLLLLAPFLGLEVRYSCPNGYGPAEEILSRAKARAVVGGGRIVSAASPEEAVADADAVYTDVWTSMGSKETREKNFQFRKHQLNLDLFSLASSSAVALHCLPMNKGQEITADVVEHPRSAIFQQSENRLHAQKALMVGLFRAEKKAAARDLEYSHVI